MSFSFQHQHGKRTDHIERRDECDQVEYSIDRPFFHFHRYYTDCYSARILFVLL